MTEKLSAAQYKYLFTLYKLQLSGAGVTKVAEEMQVSKVSAHRMIKGFVELGLAKKDGQNEIILTAEGRRIAEALDDRYAIIMAYLTHNLNLDEQTAREDGLALLTEMSERFVTAFLARINDDLSQSGNGRQEAGGVNAGAMALPDGVYLVPFRVLRVDETRNSMGNKGFEHPCRLVVRDGRGEIWLTARRIHYRSVLGRQLQGQLSRMSYWDGQRFVEAPNNDSCYILPADAMIQERNQRGYLVGGTVRIKAGASVGDFNMPVSEAQLKLNFKAKKMEKAIDSEKVVC